MTLPADYKDLTPRAVLTAIFVAVLIGATYPYVVLKLGYGPNISVVSAFFGFIIISLVGLVTGVRGTRWENNLVQTAGTSAGQVAFMCVVLAAIDMLNAKPELGFSIHLTVMQTFLWLTLAGWIGVLLAVPLRRHFIDEENLTFADGLAAGEALMVLDQGWNKARPRVASLGVGMFLSGLVAVIRDKAKLLPEALNFGPNAVALRMGTEVSLLSFGSGLLIGPRIAISMGLGMAISWMIAPPMLAERGIIAQQTFALVLRWVMWPATGFMVAGGITALILKWRLVLKTFTTLSVRHADSTDFPIRYVAGGVAVLSVLLAIVQYYSLGFPVWLTAVSLVLSFFLMLVGTRVLGETNWAPVSAMANLMQAVFAAISPGSMAINMIGSGMSGSVAINGETLMQDFRAGKIVGSNNRNLTILQLIGIPVGGIAVSLIYPALKAKYGIGGDGLASPISVKWAGFAELLNGGFSHLPSGCFAAMLIAVALGIIITVFEPRFGKFLPAPTAVGIGMLVPGLAIMPMVLGGLCQWAWAKASPETEEAFCLPFASGLISGEALVVLVFVVQAMLGKVRPNFFLLGASKAGTTSFYQYLDQHPQIYMSPIKEPNFFADEIRVSNFDERMRRKTESRALAFRQYLDGPADHKFSGGPVENRDDYLRLFRNAGNALAIGEASPAYLWSSTAPRNIAAEVPDAKLIAILRNPVERAFSQYLHMLSFADAPISFAEYFQLAIRSKSTSISELYPFLEFGLYGVQLTRYLELFPRNRIHVIWYEDYVRDASVTLQSAFRFLGVDESFQTEHSQRFMEARVPRSYLLNRFQRAGQLLPTSARNFLKGIVFRKRERMKALRADEELLIEFYRDDVNALAALLQRDLSAWLRPSS